MDRISTELVRALPIGIIVYLVNPDQFEKTIIEKTNKAAHTIIGPVMGTIIGKTIEEAHLPDRIAEGIQTAYNSQTSIGMDEMQLKEMDVPGWFHIKFFRMPDSNYVVETIEDSTKIHQATIETRYQAFIKATPDMLHLVSPEGKFLSTHVGSVPTAFDPSDYLNKHIGDVFDETFTQESLALIQKTLETGEIQEWNYELPQLPGQHFNCRFSKSGEDEVLLVIRDLTLMLQTQNQLEGLVKDRTSQLEHSNQALQSFVYAASHDLREPLTKIVAFGTRLKETQKNLDEKGHEYINVMVSAAERLSQLIDDLLGFSRLGENDETPPDRVFTTKILQEVVSDLVVSIETSEAILDIQPDIPDIYAHPMRARQVFQNLISNALKFRKPNQAPIIHIKGWLDGEFTVIEVSDNGIGFEPEFEDKILQVFTRLHSRFEYPGTGLGLALCRRILSLYGGSITAEGELGKGATFTVKFPSPLGL